jgi:hypothetical protein
MMRPNGREETGHVGLSVDVRAVIDAGRRVVDLCDGGDVSWHEIPAPPLDKGAKGTGFDACGRPHGSELVAAIGEVPLIGSRADEQTGCLHPVAQSQMPG